MKGRWTARRERIRPLNAKGALPMMVRHAAQRTRQERLKNRERKIVTTYCSLLACEIVARCWKEAREAEAAVAAFAVLNYGISAKGIVTFMCGLLRGEITYVLRLTYQLAA